MLLAKILWPVRMYALPLTITLLTVIAHAHCGTLRQYGRDWLIPKPEPQVDSKRITAKSVFIAPSFGAENVRCGAGFRQDASGRCVKLVHVNQAAQLDFLLQRLNAMYGAPVVSHSEKHPLQVAVDIPVESVNASASVEADGIYSHVRPPSGEVSIDLLSSIAQQTTQDKEDGKPTLYQQAPNGQSFLPESEENETDVIIMPSKEMFQVDEDPIVTLIDLETDGNQDDDPTQNSPLDANKSTKFEDLFDSDDDKPASVIAEESGVMAAVAKNESYVIKKETLQGSDSLQIVNDSEVESDSLGTVQTNKTQPVLSKADEVSQSDKYGNTTQQPSKPYAMSEDAMEVLSTSDRITSNKIETDDKMRNELRPEKKTSSNETSYQVNKTAADNDYMSASTSTVQSTDFTTETTDTIVTSPDYSASSLSHLNETSLDSKVSPATTALPVAETQDGDVESTEQNTSVGDELVEEDSDRIVDRDAEYVDRDTDYEYRDVDVEVEAYDDDDFAPESENVDGDLDESHSMSTDASGDQSLLTNTSNKVENNSTEGSFESVSGDGDVSEHEHIGDLGEVSVLFNQSAPLNSTNTIQKTESENSYNVSSQNGTNFSEIFRVSEEGDRTPSKTHSDLSEASASDFHNYSIKVSGDEVLNADSSVHNVNIGPQSLLEKLPTGSEEVQQVVTPQHSVHVVYPQPIIQVMNVKQHSHGHTLDVANNNEPKTELKETGDLNSPHHQFHNLSPNPLQHHNAHPVSQTPLAGEKVPGVPHTFSGSPFPAQAPPFQHPHPPYNQFRPYPMRPHPPHREEQAGFVRFPTDHRAHPHAHAHRQDAVRFPQEDSRPNDRYSRWGLDESGGTSPQQRFWSPPENRRSYWSRNRPTRRRPQLSYY